MSLFSVFLLCLLPLSALASEPEPRSLTIPLKNSLKAVIDYKFQLGSGDVVFESPLFDQLTDIVISIELPRLVGTEAFTASLSTISYSHDYSYISPSQTKILNASFVCESAGNKSLCTAKLGNTESSIVYNHGGDYSRLHNRLTIFSTVSGFIYDKSIFN